MIDLPGGMRRMGIRVMEKARRTDGLAWVDDGYRIGHRIRCQLIIYFFW